MIKNIKFITLVLGLLMVTACATSSNQVQQEVIGGVKITYLTGKPGQPLEPQEKQAAPGVYIVKQGDSVFSIASKYGLDYEKLAKDNNLGGNYLITPGQELVINGSKKKVKNKPNKPAQQKTNKQATTTAAKNNKNSKDSKNKKQAATTSKPPIAEAPAGSKAASGFIEAAPPPLAKAGWLWPFKGKPQYEAAAGREGVYASAPSSTAVRAANNGKVIYVGAELEQYGKLILISHSNGFLSVYADNSQILVANEQEVKRGQEIAVSGNAYGKGRIYFELRKGSTAINPVDIILAKTN